jgi:hypothetical protein
MRPQSKPHAGGPPIFSYLQLLIQCICSYSPHLDIVYLIRNPRTQHALVTETHINVNSLGFKREYLMFLIFILQLTHLLNEPNKILTNFFFDSGFSYK